MRPDIAGLITDIELIGRRTGWDVAWAARDMISDLPVIYITGSEHGERRNEAVPGSLLLEKRVALAQLVDTLSELLKPASFGNRAIHMRTTPKPNSFQHAIGRTLQSLYPFPRELPGGFTTALARLDLATSPTRQRAERARRYPDHRRHAELLARCARSDQPRTQANNFRTLPASF